MYLVDQSKPCAQMYLQKYCMLHKFAIINTIFLLNRLFQACVIVKRTCIAINSKLHKIANTNSNYKKSVIFYIHHHITYMYVNFQQNRGSRSVKTVRTIIFAKNCECINLPQPIKFIFKSIISDMRYRKTYMYINF